MRKIYLALYATLFFIASNAQILRQQTSPQTIAGDIPAFSEISSINTVNVPYTPATPVTYPDPVNGDTTTENPDIYDYGSILPVSFSLSDGNITSTSLGKVWTLRISIPNALSIGLTFTQFNLSSTAEMYIYNDAQTVLNYQIKKEHFNSDTVSIGSINGNAVIIYIIEPRNFGSFQSTLAIGEITAGYQPIEDVGSGIINDNNSQARGSVTTYCIPDIRCYPWHMMSAQAVARFSSNGFQGTGTLINNENNNGHAYFLTAFHVLDVNRNNSGKPVGNGVLDPDEIAALRRAVFQFQFWRTECNSQVNTAGIQFSGAVVIASNHASDMVLLELINPPGIGDNVNYAGWSRQTSAPSNTGSYIIHHPQGRNMRHTKTNYVGSYSTNFWAASYSEGVVVPGSSGAALLNENNQIVGQLKGGWTNCTFYSLTDRYGKFYRSWNDANLGQWLSPTQNLQSAPTLVLSSIEIQGDDVVSCTSTTSYNVLLGIEGCTYEWSVSGSLQIIGPTNTSVVSIQGIANSNYNYSGTITCTLRTPLKGRTRVLVLNKTVTLSIGNVSGYYTTGNTADQYPLVVDYNGDNPVQPGYTYVAITSPEITTQTWSLQFGNPTSWQFNTQTNKLEMNLPIDGWALFRLNSPTNCGNAQFEFSFSASGSYFMMSPNPANSTLTVTVNEEKLSKQKIAKSNEQDIREITIVDKAGNVLQRKTYAKNIRQVSLNVSTLRPDLYLVRISNGKIWTTLRFVKQ